MFMAAAGGAVQAAVECATGVAVVEPTRGVSTAILVLGVLVIFLAGVLAGQIISSSALVRTAISIYYTLKAIEERPRFKRWEHNGWRFWAPDDRFYRAVDDTWWRCEDQVELVEAEAPLTPGERQQAAYITQAANTLSGVSSFHTFMNEAALGEWRRP
jgi:hypothetical protein